MSTSVTPNGAFGKNSNVSILVAKGMKCAYIELLNRMPRQKDFFLDSNISLNEVLSKNELHIFEVIKNERI